MPAPAGSRWQRAQQGLYVRTGGPGWPDSRPQHCGGRYAGDLAIARSGEHLAKDQVVTPACARSAGRTAGKGRNISLFAPFAPFAGPAGPAGPARGVRRRPGVYLGYVEHWDLLPLQESGQFALQANVRDSCASPSVSRIRVQRVAAGTEHILRVYGYLAIASILTNVYLRYTLATVDCCADHPMHVLRASCVQPNDVRM